MISTSLSRILKSAFLIGAGLFCLCVVSSMHAEPFFVDLRAGFTSSYEDDGIADNGEGGWSDEGVNDMYIYPPIEFGKVSRNGYHFEIIDPTENDGKNVILLKGDQRRKDLPAEVSVKVPGVKGNYIYFIQNSVGNTRKPENYLQAVYTVEYADDTSEKIEMRHGRELRHWWVGSWWANSGERAWPVFVGRNHYAKKWSQFIGLWASQWKNPHPDRAISKITFQSECKANPAIFAVTIDNENYHKSEDIKKHFVRPEDADPGYFTEKLKKEQEFLLKELIAENHARGLRRADMYSPSLVAITVDCALSGGAGIGKEKILQDVSFEISSSDDQNYAKARAPIELGRKSMNFNTVSTKSFPNNQIYMHKYYLRLPSAMKKGCTYKFQIAKLDNHFKKETELTFDENVTETPAIKINQAAYSGIAQKRYAYLGWWAAELGAVDYSGYPEFNVVNAGNGSIVLSGEITVRRMREDRFNDKNLPEKEISGEDVYEMDISGLDTGNYHIQIPGLGRSYSFSVGSEGMKNIYRTIMRAYLHQRCGCELSSEVTDFPRPACHTRNHENGHLVSDNEPITENDRIREFSGSYHDAGDTDIFYSHLMATFKVLLAYNICPSAFADNDLNLPESGNGIPDLLDEAAWGLKFYYDNQLDDGAIYAGRANDEDYSYKNWKSEFAVWKKENPEWRKYGDLPPYGNFFPSCASTSAFAAVASYYSRAIRPFDGGKADQYLEKAEKAYSWAKKHNVSGYEREGISYGRFGWKRSLMWAAACLFEITGKEQYNKDFISLYRQSIDDNKSYREDKSKASSRDERKKVDHNYAVQWGGCDKPFALLPYATCEQPGTDDNLKNDIRKEILGLAEKQYEYTMSRHAYRIGHFRERGYWGQLSGGGVSGKLCILGYIISGDQKYLNAASLNADFQLGANPLSRTFITGLGHRPPLHPQIRDWLYNGTDNPSAGIPVYGICSTSIERLGEVYPKEIPGWRCWLDNRSKAMYSEFDVSSQLADHSFLYTCLWALEQSKMGKSMD